MITDYNIFIEDFQARDISIKTVSKETIKGETFIVLYAIFLRINLIAATKIIYNYRIFRDRNGLLLHLQIILDNRLSS